MIIWSGHIKAFVEYPDWLEGKDTFPGYVAPILWPGKEPGGAKRISKAVWGLTPFWAKEASFGKKSAYNARAETVAEKPTFRTAFKSRRCVVPATGFYERKDGRWLRFKPKDETVLAIAGLFEEPTKHFEVPTFALVTTEPNDLVADAHDRMPVVLAPEDVDSWLGSETPVDVLKQLLTPCPADWLTVEDAGPIKRAKEREPASD